MDYGEFHDLFKIIDECGDIPLLLINYKVTSNDNELWQQIIKKLNQVWMNYIIELNNFCDKINKYGYS